MSVRSDVLLWAQRIVAKGADAPAHAVLEIKTDAGIDQAQEAFHRIARTAHPDLHRTTLTAEELELVTTAYSRAAGAYQDVRSQRMTAARTKPKGDGDPLVGVSARAAAASKPAGSAVPAAGAASASGASSGQMNGKALIYYRKAELCLRRGDLKGAVLQMKMAIAGDPASTFLRTALSQIETELAKK